LAIARRVGFKFLGLKLLPPPRGFGGPQRDFEASRLKATVAAEGYAAGIHPSSIAALIKTCKSVMPSDNPLCHLCCGSGRSV
jgi:hypothetical protein